MNMRNHEQMQVIKETLKVRHVIGENTNQVNLRSKITFPVEARKVKDVSTEIRDLQATPIEDKVIVEGLFHKQIAWVANVTADVEGITYLEDAVYDLPVEHRFTTYVDLPGATPDSVVDVDARVEYVDHTDIPDTVTEGDEWQQTVILEVHVRATEVVEVECIVDIRGPSGTKLKVTKEKIRVEEVLGAEEKQVNIMNNFTLPNGAEAVKIKEVHVEIRNLTTEALPNKVIVQGTLHKQIYYIDAATRQMFEFSLDEDFTTFVHIEGVTPRTDIDVKAMVEYAKIDLTSPTTASQSVIIKLTVRAVATKEITVVTDCSGLGMDVVKTILKAEHVVAEGKQQTAIENTDITFERPARKVAKVDTRIDINRSESKILPNKVVIIGNLHKQIFYVDVCTNAVWEMSFDEPFTTFVDAKGARPDMNVSFTKRIEHVDVDNQGPLPDPNEVCPPTAVNYDPQDFKWKQTAIIEVGARVTETREIEVCCEIVGERVPCPDGEDGEPSIRYYIIQPGDTLFKIARRYGTTVDAIKALNPGIDPNNLRVGQQIKIPCGIPGAKG